MRSHPKRGDFLVAMVGSGPEEVQLDEVAS